ncbi:MAG: hypothetical protein HY809_00895 [Nitrospirae bacterium]|nr:hypothetical protein [Nitrospirota bacterium]
MRKRNPAFVYLLLMLALTAFACSGQGRTENAEEKSFKTLQEIEEVKPEKPVKIKLKRSADGEYSWELNGEDIDKVMEADKRLILYEKEAGRK